MQSSAPFVLSLRVGLVSRQELWRPLFFSFAQCKSLGCYLPRLHPRGERDLGTREPRCPHSHTLLDATRGWHLVNIQQTLYSRASLRFERSFAGPSWSQQQQRQLCDPAEVCWCCEAKGHPMRCIGLGTRQLWLPSTWVAKSGCDTVCIYLAVSPLKWSRTFC